MSIYIPTTSMYFLSSYLRFISIEINSAPSFLCCHPGCDESFPEESSGAAASPVLVLLGDLLIQ
jgi:hypothetical protein